MAAVVKTPRPEKVIFMATALDPKRMHKNIAERPAANVSSSFDG
jgi:malate/lactate dehydrogenase